MLLLTAKFRDPFAACYVKTAEGYTLWSKVITNSYFEDRCGGDNKDWANMGEFKIGGVFGAGVGTEIDSKSVHL